MTNKGKNVHCEQKDRWCFRNNKKLKGWGTKSVSTAHKIATDIDKIPHKKYVEPFLGGGTVFRAKKPSHKEIINDISCKQVKIAKIKTCGKNKKSDKCQRFLKSEKSCGRDFREVLRNHDDKDTLHYLDPPFEKSDLKSVYYKDTDLTLDEVIDAAKKLKGKVIISYKDLPEFEKKLCRKPFKCKKIPKNFMHVKYNEILAIKK